MESHRGVHPHTDGAPPPLPPPSLPPCRLDIEHQSNTAFDWDNYSRFTTHAEYMPEDWRKIHQGHACYSPEKVWGGEEGGRCVGGAARMTRMIHLGHATQ